MNLLKQKLEFVTLMNFLKIDYTVFKTIFLYLVNLEFVIHLLLFFQL